MSKFFDEAQRNTIFDFLNKLKGKEVTLMLSNGQSLSGTVPEVDVKYGSQLINSFHLTQLVGRDHYDAIVPMNTIVGLIIENPDK